MKESDLFNEGYNDKSNQEPLDNDKEAKPKRSKFVKWLLRIFDTIVDLFT